MEHYEKALELHEKKGGKISISPKINVDNKEDLALAYTPGVAEPCKRIKDNPEDVYRYTNKGNMVAVLTDGSAVLGLGNIGAKASIPVMEGKALLFKKFAGIDAMPICIETQGTEEIINLTKNISSMFGGINLEDISAPRCFEIEERLDKDLDIPVFHDDQHGTAIAVAAATINAAKVTKRKLKEMKIVINGAGAAGVAIAKMLLDIGIKDIVVCDSKGIIVSKRENMVEYKKKLAVITNLYNIKGDLKAAMKGRDVFIGVSVANLLNIDIIRTMARSPIILAMANPTPEVLPEVAKSAGAAVVGTGRSDYPNQINNVLVFPGIFKGALSVRAKRITKDMKIAATYALANIVNKEDISAGKILPDLFETDVARVIAEAVAKAWKINY